MTPNTVATGPMDLCLTNLRMLRYPDIATLQPSSFALVANPKQSDALFHFLLTHLDRARASRTFRTSFPPHDHATRREFRQLVYAWLDEIKSLMAGTTSIRKSSLDEGRGERFQELLLALSTLVLQESLARHDRRAPAHLRACLETPSLAAPLLARVQRAYASTLRTHAATQSAWKSLATDLTADHARLDSALSAPRPPPSATPESLQSALCEAHADLAALHARLLAAVPWTQAQEVLDAALHAPAPVLAPADENAAEVDWAGAVRLADLAMRPMAKATLAHVPVHRDALDKWMEAARKAEEVLCAKRQRARNEIEVAERMCAAGSGGDPLVPSPPTIAPITLDNVHLGPAQQVVAAPLRPLPRAPVRRLQQPAGFRAPRAPGPAPTPALRGSHPPPPPSSTLSHASSASAWTRASLAPSTTATTTTTHSTWTRASLAPSTTSSWTHSAAPPPPTSLFARGPRASLAPSTTSTNAWTPLPPKRRAASPAPAPAPPPKYARPSPPPPSVMDVLRTPSHALSPHARMAVAARIARGVAAVGALDDEGEDGEQEEEDFSTVLVRRRSRTPVRRVSRRVDGTPASMRSAGVVRTPATVRSEVAGARTPGSTASSSSSTWRGGAGDDSVEFDFGDEDVEDLTTMDFRFHVE
ncbi:hypothetical protein GGF31_007826 [Allomyces arbusculus]|nr:hypothetical protein GGF31_007826 [Allomyces arbusculus]